MLIGITRIRNAEGVIENTLDHVAKFVDVVYVFDDASTDNTKEICKKHPIVEKVFSISKWNNTTGGRAWAEGKYRQLLYE